MRNAELYLAVNPRRINAAAEAPLVAGRGSRWTRGEQHRIFFDTPRLRMHRHGVVVSLARNGRRWQQSVEREAMHSAASDEASIHRFITGDAPQLTTLDVPVLGAALDTDPSRVVLKPVFEMDIQRTCRQLEAAPQVRIGICIERGALHSRKNVLPVSEVKLTLLAGQYADLLEFAAQFRESVPFVVEPRTQVERGYALREGNAFVPVKAAHSALAREMSVADACCAVITGCLAHFAANQLGMLRSADPEFLHQMRVALRRLRSAIGLFRAAIPEHAWAELLADVRWLARSLGPARDWDVFTIERLPDMKTHFRDEPGMVQLEEKCMEGRMRATQRARRAVGSARCQCFLLRFAKSVEQRAWSTALTVLERETVRQNIVPYAAATLEQRYQLVRKRGRNIGRLSEAELHRLRIAVKKLRYAAEFFGTLFGDARVSEFRSAATGLQEVLGQINDANAATAMLAGINQPPQHALTTACALLAGWNRHEIHRLKSGLAQIWDTFRDAPTFWRDHSLPQYTNVRAI